MPTPPIAETRPHAVTAPAGTRNDEYYWLRDDTREDAKVLAYLNAENAYADALLASSKPLAGKLYEEIVGRIKQDDASVPYRLRGYWYYSRYETGKDYPIVARRKESMEAEEEILLDENAMAAGHEFFMVGESEVSQDNRLLAWADDTIGRRQYTLRVKEIAAAACSRTRSPTSRRTWCGATTTAPCTTSRRTRSPCCPSASRRTCSARRWRRTGSCTKSRTKAST
jgi:oligopeptidase B